MPVYHAYVNGSETPIISPTAKNLLSKVKMVAHPSDPITFHIVEKGVAMHDADTARKYSDYVAKKPVKVRQTGSIELSNLLSEASILCHNLSTPALKRPLSTDEVSELYELSEKIQETINS